MAPLLAIRPLPQSTPDLEGVTALAFTSVNGVEAFAALSRLRDRPVFTVGDATAEAARAAGFRTVRSASGGLADLAALIAEAMPSGGRVLAPGALEPSGDLPALLAGRVAAEALPVYEAVETGAAVPDACDAVLIHSRRAAKALAALGPAAAADRLAVVISDVAAEPLGGAPFRALRVALAPTEAALLAALGQPDSA